MSLSDVEAEYYHPVTDQLYVKHAMKNIRSAKKRHREHRRKVLKMIGVSVGLTGLAAAGLAAASAYTAAGLGAWGAGQVLGTGAGAGELLGTAAGGEIAFTEAADAAVFQAEGAAAKGWEGMRGLEFIHEAPDMNLMAGEAWGTPGLGEVSPSPRVIQNMSPAARATMTRRGAMTRGMTGVNRMAPNRLTYGAGFKQIP